jgi:hypothetical protein
VSDALIESGTGGCIESDCGFEVALFVFSHLSANSLEKGHGERKTLEILNMWSEVLNFVSDKCRMNNRQGRDFL